MWKNKFFIYYIYNITEKREEKIYRKSNNIPNS